MLNGWHRTVGRYKSIRVARGMQPCFCCSDVSIPPECSPAGTFLHCVAWESAKSDGSQFARIIHGSQFARIIQGRFVCSHVVCFDSA